MRSAAGCIRKGTSAARAIAPLKLEKRLLPLHSERALRLILTHRPKTFIQWRVYAIACTILDTGCRIEELLTARITDFDFDNLLLTWWGRAGSSARCRSRSNCGRRCSGSSRSKRRPGSRRI